MSTLEIFLNTVGTTAQGVPPNSAVRIVWRSVVTKDVKTLAWSQSLVTQSVAHPQQVSPQLAPPPVAPLGHLSVRWAQEKQHQLPILLNQNQKENSII